jgi:2'-5' RNA ligase
MVFVCHSTKVTHYLKIVRVPGSIPVTSGQVRDAFLALQKKPIPKTIPRRLTFAMKLSENHHCTICFVDREFTDEMIDCIENYLQKWENYQFDIVARGVAQFGQSSVILLEFTSEGYNELFQTTSQQGTPEGGSVVRTPHLTYYASDIAERNQFILNILDQL